MTFVSRISCRRALPLVLATTTLAGASSVSAQPTPYNIGDAVRQTEELRRAPLPRPAAVPVLPRLTEPQLMLRDKETLLVRSFEVDGPDVVDAAEVRAILAPYEGQKLTIGQIYEAADRISTLYRDHGYLVAKAYVPVQNIRRGTLKIKIVAGQYGSVTVRNESLVRDDYVQGLIDHALGRSPYIHKDPLERAILLVSDLPGAGVPRVAIGAAGAEDEEIAQTIPDEVDERQLIQEYVRELSKRVQSNLVRPGEGGRDGRRHSATVAFAILGNGQIRPDTLRIIRSSGQPRLETSALQTIRTSLPFPPPPKEMTIAIIVDFDPRR